jgi:hypothetical protein
MTHSFEQDSAILACLLALANPPAYIGVLGPQRRTRELLGEAARLLNLPASAIAGQESAGWPSCMPRPAWTWARNRPKPLLFPYCGDPEIPHIRHGAAAPQCARIAVTIAG